MELTVQQQEEISEAAQRIYDAFQKIVEAVVKAAKAMADFIASCFSVFWDNLHPFLDRLHKAKIKYSNLTGKQKHIALHCKKRRIREKYAKRIWRE